MIDYQRVAEGIRVVFRSLCFPLLLGVQRGLNILTIFAVGHRQNSKACQIHNERSIFRPHVTLYSGPIPR